MGLKVSARVARALTVALSVGAAAFVMGAAMAGGASTAGAAVVGLSQDGSTLIYRAAPGEANNLRVSFFQDFTNPTVWTVQDTGASVTAYAGCAVDPSLAFVSCGAGAPFSITAMEIDLGDGADRFRADDNGVISRTVIAGGPGNDDLLGIAHAANTLLGQDGDDRINADYISALPGTFGGDAISGGNGDDVLVGGGGRDRIDGDAGNDLISDTYGNGVLNGGAGDDTIHGGVEDDVIDGGDGRDTITAGDGNDRVTGGAGGDSIAGQSGNDLIEGRDGELDQFSCGLGADSVLADAIDVVGADDGSNCEQVSRGGTPAVAGSPNAGKPAFRLSGGRSQHVSRSGSVRVSARCSRVCVMAGVGELRIAGRQRSWLLAADGLTLRAGGRGVLRLAIPGTSRSVVRRALRAGHVVTASIRVSVTDAVAGRRIATLRVRLRL